MPKVAIFLPVVILVSFFIYPSDGFLEGDILQQNPPSFKNINIEPSSGILEVSPNIFDTNVPMKRYLVFGDGLPNLKPMINNAIYSIKSDNGFFSVAVLPENAIFQLRQNGYYVIEDFPLDFHSEQNSKDLPEASQIGKIVGSNAVHEKYNYTGKGIKIAIVDTGVDFSNIDIRDSLARDQNNIPIMLDADGQGIIITNATYVANIDKNEIIRNYTKTIPANVTSSVYKTRDGVFLNNFQSGNGTTIHVYNALFPQIGNSPIFNGTLNDDMKIGRGSHDYIISKSGMYHLGVMYQGVLEEGFARIQVVPVLVVDSKEAGKYDTIIPDLSTSWKDFTRFDLENDQDPEYDFDFTDEKSITLGSGNEFLVYSSNDDEIFDYSTGTVGAQVLDIYGVVQDKKSEIDKTLGSINGTLLPPLDPDGNFFGVMTDILGHGTSSAASITSKGIQEYDIYNNTKKYTIKGVAPDAKIIPVKALWFGDTVYSWLWLAGFDNVENKWAFQGLPRTDIISNSWGISNFPSLQEAPGLDILSLIVSALVTPHSLDQNYPGVTVVTSAGNSGHGYGTIGLPTASPFGISVGATSNNVFVGYGPFKEEPRFGNSTVHTNNVVDFSSRGPGIIGDPKPDLMSIGAYSFTPSSVTKMTKDSKKEPFSLFGGTSMAAPLVAGTAALVMQGLNENFDEYDPFTVKNILMSTATDLHNDPFTQGSGLVNVDKAAQYVQGERGIFIVHNDASYSNLKKILDIPINNINSTTFGVDRFLLPHKNFPLTSWFGGQIFPGEMSSTTFTIQNPSDEILEIKIQPQTLKLMKKGQLEGITEVQTQDPILNKSGTYTPNFVRLSDVKEHEDLESFFEYSNPIPENTSLLILNVNFPFDNFMNKTDSIYANDLKISSLYLYDWIDINNDTKISSDELSMVNRAGSWGTVQEMRISDPDSKFEGTPLVGIYPVPVRYSYWLGETEQNSTSMDYTLSSSYYKKDTWNTIWLDSSSIEVPPHSSTKVKATIVTPTNIQTGVYQGFLNFEGKEHVVNVPVSFAVKMNINDSDSFVLIDGKPSDEVLFGTGFVKGAFDMVNRYMSGDWRQFYFDIDNEKINTAAIEISWENDDTNFSVFVIDPQGRIAQTNMPSGVFGHFLNWPSLDWLGTSPFSQGGGFFPVKNKDSTSSLILVPINQTGTYSLMAHSTLFGGNHATEPITLSAKFSNISSDKKSEIIIESELIEDKTIEQNSWKENSIVESPMNLDYDLPVKHKKGTHSQYNNKLSDTKNFVPIGPPIKSP